MLGGTFFSAISQILLKQSANIKYSNPLREYLNWRVILAYFLFFGILLLNTWCYTKVDMRYGPVIDTAAYVFVLLLSKVILKEKITRGKFIGNLIIIAGIIVYTL
jgi:drug/metabolite transporter (DMT)-like permease